MSNKVPQNLEAEQAVLGCLLLDPDALPKSRTILESENFWNDGHKAIYEAAITLFGRKEPLEVLALESELDAQGKLILFGNQATTYLVNLMDAPTSSANILYYAGLVKREANKRELLLKLREANEMIRHDPEGIEKIANSNGYFALSEIARQTSRSKKSPFSRGFLSAADMRQDEPATARLWFALYPGALTYLCGETGAGKSSWLYNLMIHAARNEPLWNIPFGLLRPLKVLYIDPENSGQFDAQYGGLSKEKLARIDQGWPANLVFHDGQGLNLSDPEQRGELADLLRREKYDVLVLDPIISLFTTLDENDNAEAGAQFAALKLLCKQTGCAIAAVHHTGKDGSGIFGRGATARLGAADVGMVIRVRGETEEVDDDYGDGDYRPRNDVIRCQIVKNRIEPGKASLFLRMIGEDRFERVRFDDWKAAAGGKKEGGEDAQLKKLFQCREAIQTLMLDHLSRPTQAIIEAMNAEGIGINTTREALRELVEDKLLNLSREGHKVSYQLPGATEPVKTELKMVNMERFLSEPDPYEEE